MPSTTALEDTARQVENPVKNCREGGLYGGPGKTKAFNFLIILDFIGTYGGEGGIRTHGPRKGSLDFESSPFGHSGTSPIIWHDPLVAEDRPDRTA